MTLAKKIFAIASLALCLSSFAGKIAIVKDPPDGSGIWGCIFQSLADTLTQEGHELDYDRYFGWREPSGYEIYFLMIDSYYFVVDTKVESLITYVENGGRLILQEYSHHRPLISDFLSDEYSWPCFTGNPRWNIIDPRDSIPRITYSPFSLSVVTNFLPSWKPGVNLDTLVAQVFFTYSFDSSGILKAVATGGLDVSTSLYDSFPPAILSGRCGRGEITTLGGHFLLCDVPFDWFNMLSLFDNCQFARQLFQCNERADSAWLVLESDSTAKAYLVQDSLLFMPDSSYWEVRFTVDTIRNYSFYGHEYSAEGFEDSLAVTFRPGYFYDTVEVCLVRLPDSTGETILPCGRICDTFPERTGIAETPTPQSFAISAYPNPFNSSVTISLDFGSESAPWDFPSVKKPLSTIEIFDVNGRRVAQLPVGEGLKPSRSLTGRQAGGSETTPLRNGKFTWTPDESLGSGIYLIRATSPQQTTSAVCTKRVVYLR